MDNKISNFKLFKEFCASKKNGFFKQTKKGNIQYISYYRTLKKNKKKSLTRIKKFKVTFKKNKNEKYDLYYKNKKISINITDYEKILSILDNLDNKKNQKLVNLLGLSKKEIKYIVYKNKKNNKFMKSCKNNITKLNLLLKKPKKTKKKDKIAKLHYLIN